MRLKLGSKWEAPDGKVWKVAPTQPSKGSIALEAAGGGAVGNLTVTRKGMRGWKEVG